MLQKFHLRLLVAGPLLAIAGCGTFAPPANNAAITSLLKPATASDDSVTLEIFFARFALDSDDLNNELWALVDEQQLDSETRRRLSRNGIRSGMIGAQVPDSLARLMQLSDQAPSEEEKKQGVPLDVEPLVNKRLLQLRFGMRGEIVTSPVVDEISLLMSDGGVLAGTTFREAQAVFTAEVHRRGGNETTLALSPELRHGQAQQQWTGQDGILRLDMARDRELFENLQIRTAIAPGQILLVGCLPAAKGSLGHHFFTGSCSEGRLQKLLIIRAVNVPAQPVFGQP